MGTVSKKNLDEFRMNLHRSYAKASFIKDNVPAQYCSVEYQSIDNAIIAIKQIEVCALLSKSDLEKLTSRYQLTLTTLNC